MHRFPFFQYSLCHLHVIDILTEYLEHDGQIDVVYTDLEKAFDEIPHKRLISKVFSCGLNNEIIAWIIAFVTNRKQRVTINSAFSELTPLICI